MPNAQNSTAPESAMAHNKHFLETVAFPESFGLELQNTTRTKMLSLSGSSPVKTDFQDDGFDQAKTLLNAEDFGILENGNHETIWKHRNIENIYDTVKQANGLQMPTVDRQMSYGHQTGDPAVVRSSSESRILKSKTFKRHADNATRKSINSDSSSSHFDSFESDDVSLVKAEELAEKDCLVEPVSCSVCGDTVAGFHCGAYVCEACKKFFVRCLKQDAGLRFTCAHNKSCEITKETRTQCPCCRFQKCLKLGMYKPGGPNVSSEIGHIPCKVCGAPSSGFHFGAITCEGCKGFFRRTVKERDSLKYQCSRNSSCIITWKTRNICKMCRYKQCLKAGMKPDKSRIGRQPNSVKHATMLELNQIKSAKGLAPLPFPIQECKREPEDYMESENGIGLPSLSDSGQGVSMVTSSDPVVHCDSDSEVKYNAVELESLGNAPRLKNENRGEFHNEEVVYVNDHVIANLHKAQGKKPPVAAPPPLSPQAYPGKLTKQTSGTSSSDPNDFNVDPQLVVDSCKSFSSPARDGDQFYDKYLPVDNQGVPVMYYDISCSVPIVKPFTVMEKPPPPPALPDYDSVISIIQHSYKDLSIILTRSDSEVVTAASSITTVWDNMMTQFAHCAQATLRFAKKVPGFRKFAISEQIHMIQSSMFPIVVVILSLIYDEENERFCYFMYSHEEMCLILRKFEPFRLLVPVLHHMGQKVRQLGLDETEVAFLCALHLMDSGNKLVYKELLLDSLEEYIKRKFGQVCDRNGQILLCLRDMVSANHIHQQAVNALLSEGSKYSNLEIPQLFKESFVAMDD